jgi:protein-tyrosine phosphatase
MGALFFNPRHLSVLMLETYTEVMLDRNAKLFAELLTRLSQPENLPALFHCTAGKDRTGIAAMLLLLVLGVPEETIIADYTLSNLYYQEYLAYANQVIERYRWLGLRGERMYPLLIADAKTIKSAIDYLHNRYGTVENYLYTAGEIDKDVISRLRENLLEEIV